MQLQPKQGQLYDLVEMSAATRIAIGGSRGGGKSEGGRLVMLLRRMKYPHTTGLVFRRTMDELRSNHLVPLFRQYPEMRAWFNVHERTLTLPNQSQIAFGYADHPGDIYQFQGKQFTDVFIDESTHLTEEEVHFLGTCCRWPGTPDHQCKMWFAMNPGGVGHSYFKRIFIDKVFESNELPEQYEFLPTYGWDNASWAESALREDGLTQNDYYRWSDDERKRYFIERTQYGRELNSLPEHLRIQHLHGDWNFFQGQVFSELNDRDHNLDRWIPKDPRIWYEFHRPLRKVGGFDHGTSGVTAYVLVAIDADENLFVLAEHYEADRLIVEHADAIKRMLSEYGRIDYQVADPSTEYKSWQNEAEMFSVLDAYRRVGVSMIPARRASIGVGLDLLKSRLRVDETRRHPFEPEKKGSPQLFISRSRCPNLWKEMSELQCVSKDGRVEYIGRDHATDCLRYVAMSRPLPAERGKVEREDAMARADRVAAANCFDRLKLRSEEKFKRTHGGMDKGGTWY